MRIRTATLNAWALPGPLSQQVPQRMRAIGAALADLDLDLIAFQEVWSDAARRILVRAGEAHGLPHAWYRGAFEGSGLVVLSRLPLAEPRFQHFSLPRVPPRPDHPDYYVGKGFLRVTLETPAGPVDCFTTHLQARYGGDVDHEYRAVRAGQVVELSAAVRASRRPSALLGDFNFRPGDDGYRVLAGLTRMRDAALEAGTPEPTVFGNNPYRRPNHREKRIDYVFVRDGADAGLRVASARRAFDRPLEIDGRRSAFSDHGGVVAELEIHDAPGPRRGPDPDAVQLATTLLSEGRHRAVRQHNGARQAAAIGIGAAAVAAASVRNRRVSRRRLLCTGVRLLGIAAVTPCAGYAVLNELFAPDAVAAYDDLAARLEDVSTDLVV